MTVLNWSRLARVEARAPEPFEPLEITWTVVEPSPTGPVTLGVYKRFRRDHPHEPPIIEYFPEILDKGKGRGGNVAPAGTEIPNPVPA